MSNDQAERETYCGGVSVQATLAYQKACKDGTVKRDTPEAWKNFYAGWQARAALDGGADRLLGNLLAVIHRDGGHYQAQHGDAIAARDATIKVVAWLSRDDEQITSAPNSVADELDALECLDLSPAFKNRILAALRTTQPQDDARALLVKFCAHFEERFGLGYRPAEYAQVALDFLATQEKLE